MRALVMSGGAVKGAYEAGVLRKWLGDDEIVYDILCGVSVGAINASFLCQTPKGKPKEAIESLVGMWNRVLTSKVHKHWFPLGSVEALWKSSIFNSEPLQDWIRSELDAEAIAKSGTLLRVGAVAWDNGEYHLGTEKDPEIVDWVIASSSFPVFLNPVKINERLWSDGGLRNVTPLAAALRAGADEIDVIMCSNPDLGVPWTPEGKAAFPDFLLRTIDLMSDEIIRTDLKVCLLKNSLADTNSEYRKVKVRIVQPLSTLVENSLEFNQTDIQRMLSQGYADAQSVDAYQTYGVDTEI